MGDKDKSKIGMILWTDLTIENAEEIGDFYSKVVGWKPQPVSMGDYNDFNMTNPVTGDPVVGICHKRSGNSTLPSQWLNYFSVENLEESILQCQDLGGRIIAGPNEYGDLGRYCIIEDPAGAVCALYETV